MKKETIVKYILFFILPLFFMSCQKDGCELRPPEPSENPVYFTAEAQIMFMDVKNLFEIYPENRETDQSYRDENDFSVVENDWITITRIISSTSMIRESLKIVVKENADVNSRTYNLPMSGMPGDGILKIIQAGAAGN